MIVCSEVSCSPAVLFRCSERRAACSGERGSPECANERRRPLFTWPSNRLPYDFKFSQSIKRRGVSGQPKEPSRCFLYKFLARGSIYGRGESSSICLDAVETSPPTAPLLFDLFESRALNYKMNASLSISSRTSGRILDAARQTDICEGRPKPLTGYQKRHPIRPRIRSRLAHCLGFFEQLTYPRLKFEASGMRCIAYWPTAWSIVVGRTPGGFGEISCSLSNERMRKGASPFSRPRQNPSFGRFGLCLKVFHCRRVSHCSVAFPLNITPLPDHCPGH